VPHQRAMNTIGLDELIWYIPPAIVILFLVLSAFLWSTMGLAYPDRVAFPRLASASRVDDRRPERFEPSRASSLSFERNL
jgi:hypothetical protein